jgi:pseudaminic acid synthase
MKSIFIDSREISEANPPYIIAEISGNHDLSIDKALSLIESAKENGASAVKIQTFTPDCLTLNTDKDDFKLSSGTWKGLNLYELYQKTKTPFEWHEKLFEESKNIGITLFSSPFSFYSLSFLSTFNPPAFKIASNELHDWALVKKIAEEKKPIIMSTGVANIEELEKTVEIIRKCKNNEIIILHCISSYPALSSDANIKTILSLKKKFNLIVGFSDHTLNSTASCTAIAYGASVIEKHFTLNREDGGPDSSFSIEPMELKKFVIKCNETWESIGEVKYASRDELKKNSIYLRQLWTTSNIKKGEILGWHNIRSIRAPSDSGGVSSMDYEKAIGHICNSNITKHNPLKINDILVKK